MDMALLVYCRPQACDPMFRLWFPIDFFWRADAARFEGLRGRGTTDAKPTGFWHNRAPKSAVKNSRTLIDQFASISTCSQSAAQVRAMPATQKIQQR
jgi:hypothetical protein